MSSKVMGSGEQLPMGPVPWRRVAGAGSPPGALDTEARAGELQAECERRVREAHAAGAQEGQAAARGQAAAEVQTEIERLGKSIAEMATLRARLRRDAETDLVRLALAIAHRIIRRELAIDPDAMHGLILGALERLQALEITRVRTHPSHAAALTRCLAGLANCRTAQVQADPSCEPGSIVFETERGNLDASVDTQLQEIERGLADRLRGWTS